MSSKGKPIIITEHAQQRLREMRQQAITVDDIVAAATSIPGMIVTATRFRGFIAASGRPFDLVVKDLSDRRVVITVIGK
ncbi:MAG: hypothetical protein QMC81_01980 [Thermoanaerobacterales bacterium]|nr:hypothetical protein [Bacillota bacterium]MDI6906243.1 hypothetical protein [Thermoanaerobacterales bacterium]